MISKLFSSNVEIQGNLIFSNNVSSEIEVAQEQTKDTFSEKWVQFEEGKKKDEVYKFQKEWFLKLYGFNSEKQLKEYLPSNAQRFSKEEFTTMIKKNNLEKSHFHEQEAC